MVVSCDNGKYVWEFNEATSQLTCTRYGEEWRDETGDGAILALLQEFDTLRDTADDYINSMDFDDLRKLEEICLKYRGN